MAGGNEYKKGLWTEDEDKVLMDYVRVHGKGKWNRVSKFTSLKRCGKSCRLRWINYLSPHVKRGEFSVEEQELIIRLHNLLGNRWSLIAGRVPGRTDNQVKNYWNNYLNKKKLGVTKKGTISQSSELQEKQDRKEIAISSNVSSESISEPVSSCAGGSEGDKEIDGNVGDEARRGGFDSREFLLPTADIDLHAMDPFFWCFK